MVLSLGSSLVPSLVPSIRLAKKTHENVKTENDPVYCGYMDQVEKKILKDCIVLINIQPAL